MSEFDILKANSDELTKLEKECGLHPDFSNFIDDIEIRRARLVFYINMISADKFEEQNLRTYLNVVFGESGYRLEVYNDDVKMPVIDIETYPKEIETRNIIILKDIRAMILMNIVMFVNKIGL